MTSRTRTAEAPVTTPSPSEPRARLTLALILVALTAASLAITVLHKEAYGVIYLCRSGNATLAGQVEGSYPIVYDFTHSVHKTNEKDVLVAGSHGFIIKAVALREYGAGTPYEPGDIGGSVVVDVDGYTVYTGGRIVGYKVVQSLNLPVYMNVFIGRVSFETGECLSLELINPS